MNQARALVVVAAELRLFLRPGRRGGPVRVAVDGTSSLGHVVESLGVPLTEVGRLRVDGEPALPGYRPGSGDVVTVDPVRRPQHLEPRFVLDVHLGTLARRLRLVGVDTANANDADDDALVEQAMRAGGCCSPKIAACCAAGSYGWAPTCGGHAQMTSSGMCWTGSCRPSRPRPGARRATGTCPRPQRDLLTRC